MNVVATKHAKASLMERIAMTVLAAVDDRRRCLKTQKASLGTVESVSWDRLVAGQAVYYVALAGDKFLETGHPDVGGMRSMVVDCTRQSVILGHLLRTMESQRTMRGETTAVDWRQQRRGNCKAVDVRSDHSAGSCSAGAQR